jgi:hypothetical protein
VVFRIGAQEGRAQHALVVLNAIGYHEADLVGIDLPKDASVKIFAISLER